MSYECRTGSGNIALRCKVLEPVGVISDALGNAKVGRTRVCGGGGGTVVLIELSRRRDKRSTNALAFDNDRRDWAGISPSDFNEISSADVVNPRG